MIERSTFIKSGFCFVNGFTLIMFGGMDAIGEIDNLATLLIIFATPKQALLQEKSDGFAM